jgi:HicB family
VSGGEAFSAGETVPVGEGGMARINLRLPEQLKGRVEQAAEQDDLSINAWLVRAVAAAVERGRSGGGEHRTTRGGQHYTGWGR